MGFVLAIFKASMKIFRSHILRAYSFFVLMIGITLHLAGDSEQQAHHAAFTSWLGSHLKNVDSEAHLALEKLSKDNAALDEVIRKASELVASHSDDFTLPLDASSDEQGESEDMYHLLLEQWNHFQNSEAGMGKAIFVEAAKSTTILPNDGKFASMAGLSTLSTGAQVYPAENSQGAKEFSTSFLLRPLASGTAIGAP